MRDKAADKDNNQKGAPPRPVLIRLWPYIWPRQRADLRLRIFARFGLLVLAKLATVAVPYAFKWATDALVALIAGGGRDRRLRRARRADPALRALRVVMAGLTQARDALFADVAMNAVRRLAVDVFVHLHALSMRFHLERKTGALTRVLERGRNAIETLSRMVTLNGCRPRWNSPDPRRSCCSSSTGATPRSP